MSDIYGAYKNARDAAWRVLLDFAVEALPVSVSRIAKAAGMIIAKNSLVHKLAPNEAAVSYRIDHKWYIVYDDTMPHGRSRFSIAHELGHIF